MGLFKLSLAALLSEGTDAAPKNPPGRRCALACHLISLFLSQPSSGAGVFVQRYFSRTESRSHSAQGVQGRGISGPRVFMSSFSAQNNGAEERRKC